MVCGEKVSKQETAFPSREGGWAVFSPRKVFGRIPHRGEQKRYPPAFELLKKRIENM